MSKSKQQRDLLLKIEDQKFDVEGFYSTFNFDTFDVTIKSFDGKCNGYNIIELGKNWSPLMFLLSLENFELFKQLLIYTKDKFPEKIDIKTVKNIFF
jgi:hypothetical protein